ANRPRVTLTFAQSLDGKIAGAGGAQLALSGSESMLMTHWMRTMHQGILVGIGTALNDNPQLNIRHVPADVQPRPPAPTPIIVDTTLRLPNTCKLLQNYRVGTGLQPWIVHAQRPHHDADAFEKRRAALQSAGAELVPISTDSSGLLSMQDVLQALHIKGIKTLMVEGGARIIRSFLNQHADERAAGREGLIDNLIITLAPTLVGDEGVGYGV
ncbi:bacterial bifunctional deaminase-reductase, partial [Coniophora puteana RWD-64-598 SS2]